MNLHAIVGPVIAAVNPPLLCQIFISTGQTSTAADGSRTPLYATPGALVGSIAANVLTVTAVGSGILQAGQTLGGTGLLQGTAITGQLSGAVGGIGTYSLNNSQTVASEALTTSLALYGQVQPLTSRDLMQIDGLNQNGLKNAIYVNGEILGVVRVLLKGGDLVQLPDGTTWLVVQPLEDFSRSAGWSKAAIVLQDGA